MSEVGSKAQIAIRIMSGLYLSGQNLIYERTFPPLVMSLTLLVTQTGNFKILDGHVNQGAEL